MSSREDRFAEAGRLSQLLTCVADRARADFVATVTEFGLPVQLARVLVQLTTPAPMRALAEQMGCDRSYITSLADQLEQRGLISRTPGADRRVKLLTLTEEGRALRDRISQAVAERNLLLHRLTDDERATLAPLLERLYDEETDPGCSIQDAAAVSGYGPSTDRRGHDRGQTLNDVADHPGRRETLVDPVPAAVQPHAG